MHKTHAVKEASALNKDGILPSFAVYQILQQRYHYSFRPCTLTVMLPQNYNEIMETAGKDSIQANRRLPQMLVPTIILGLIAVVLIYFGQQKGVHIQGLQVSWIMFVQIIPLLIFALIIAGMSQVLIPQELVSKWIGVESGLRGILIGSFLGGLAPGGPMTSLPIAAGLLRTGASMGTMVAFLTGWSLLAFTRMPLEIGIMGWQFTLIRFACVFFFPPIAGLIAHAFFSHIKVV
jgi:uncharacterized membrane protein YraQ (UPF0718 family)